MAADYDISPDGKRVVFSVADTHGRTHLWLAQLDLSSSPRQFLSSVDEDEPLFDSNGNLYFRAAEGRLNFVYRMKEDGSDRVKLLPDTITELSDDAVSPDGRWVVAAHAVPENQHVPFARMAFPLGGGTPITICHNCAAGWAPGGQFFYVTLLRKEGNKTLLVPVPLGQCCPIISRTVSIAYTDRRPRGCRQREKTLMKAGFSRIA